MGRIVVGVDGSQGADRALRWAAEEARLRGAGLEVVLTYEHKPGWSAYTGDESMDSGEWERRRAEIEARAREAAEHAEATVQRLVEGVEDVEVEALAIESDHPARTLVERSKDADLLVVGSRGLGGFKSLMLGSVSQQCAQHAPCPVTIVRSGAEQGG